MSQGDGVYIIGSGGHARVVVAAVRAGGQTPVAILDDDCTRWGSLLDGVEIIGGTELLDTIGANRAIIAIGCNRVRKEIVTRNPSVHWSTIIHPFSWVAPGVRVGDGCIVCAGVVIQPGTEIGSHSIINTCASVDHDCVIGAYCHIAPGCHLTGQVHVEDGVLLGAGCSVIPRCVIGAWSTIGAGSVVIRNVAPGTTVVGTPARLLGKLRHE